MCIEKTPWEQVIEFHGETNAEIAIGYRLSQIALRELGIKPTSDTLLVIKAGICSSALDAFQILAQATIGRGTLLIDDCGKHAYQFHYTGTKEILRLSVSKEVIDQINKSKAYKNNREKQQNTLQTLEFILGSEENSFCRISRTTGQLTPYLPDYRWNICAQCNEPAADKYLDKTSLLCTECASAQ